jgi:hypothetical protein
LAENYLIISDLQIPFEHPKALEFCLKVQKEFKICKTNILCVGDEIDGYWASRFPKDPDAIITARGELKLARERLKAWYKAFPFCRVAISNHGLRWAAKAYESFIPSEIIRPYKEIIEAPNGWMWADEIVVKAKTPFRMVHGVGYSGLQGARNAAIDSGMNTVIGHLHSHASVNYITTGKKQIWSMNAGCLISQEAMAFHYAKNSRFKATLSCGVVLGDGQLPMVVPFGSL